MPILVTAEAGAVDLTAVFTAALGTVQTVVQNMISAALPIGLGIMGTILAIRVGVRFFRGLVA